MNPLTLVGNLLRSPLLPRGYASATIKALGGSFDLESSGSKQGGVSPCNFKWEDNSLCQFPTDVFQIDNLLSYCHRHQIFYCILAAPDQPEKVTVAVSPSAGQPYRSVTLTGWLAGPTLAACLVQFLNTDNTVEL